jgi:lipoate---protein ligase
MKLIFSTLTTTADNLAYEEYLFAESNDNILLLYINEPSVIIGFNQVVQNEVDIDFCRDHRIKIIRRISGGGAVYHDLGNLNYSFITNRIEDKPALSDEFLTPIVTVLHQLNIPVSVGKRQDLWLPGGFKVSGTASHITKDRELHHGTLLIDTDMNALQESLKAVNKDFSTKGTASVPSNVKNILQYLTKFFIDISREKLIEQLIAGLEVYYSTKCIKYHPDEMLSTLVEKYLDENWNFKK